MLEFFRLAEQTRKPEYRDVPLADLMRQAAKEAGWHTVYVENLQSRTKDQVRYERPFSSAVTAELACRMKAPIMAFLSKRDIDKSTINSYIGYGFFNFIKTYKPDVLDTDEKIKAAIYRSVQNKVDQGNRKEIFRYRESSNKYVNTPKEISMSIRIGNGDNEGDGKELEDYLADTLPSPDLQYMEIEETEELLDIYANSNTQEILLKLLLESGSFGRVSVRGLSLEAGRYPSIREEAIKEIELKIKHQRERAGKTKKDLPEDKERLALDEENISKFIYRKVKKFYRELKSKLIEKYPYLKNNKDAERDLI